MNRSSRLLASITFTIVAGALALLSMTSCGTPVEPDPLPSLHYQPTAQGCGDIFVYKWNESRTEAIVVQGSREGLGLSTQSRTFDLSALPAGTLHVWIDRFTRTTLSPYCTDVLNPDQEAPHKWNAASGAATITLDRDTIAAGDTFKVTVKLKNVRFTNGNESVTLGEESFDDVTVGWFPG